MKTYIYPATNVFDIQTENVILGVSSGGDGPIKGTNEDTQIGGGGTRVPLRNLWI